MDYVVKKSYCSMDQSLVVTIEMSLYNTVGTSAQYSLMIIGFR